MKESKHDGYSEATFRKIKEIEVKINATFE